MIKAIETEYNGYRFRSRLEARWAVFFDTLGIKYEYEKEGYDLKGVLYWPSDTCAVTMEGEKVPHKGAWYLPDFWLPQHKYWIEIKGQEPTDEEIDKMSALTGLTKHTGFILWGEIEIPKVSYFQSVNWIEYRDGGYHDSNREWVACKTCGAVDITFSGRGDYITGCKCYNGKYDNVDHDRLERAFLAARQARFEHGERP